MRMMFAIMLLWLPINYTFGNGTLVYNQQVSQKVFIDIEGNRIDFPAFKEYSLCFFIKGTDLDLQRLNELLSFSYPDESKIDVFVFFQNGVEAKHMNFINSWDFYFFSVEKNKNENKSFFNKVCGTCFSMLVVHGDKVKFFHSGFNLHYFAEIIKEMK